MTCSFVALVQIGEANDLSRRRARTAELITSEADKPQVEAIIKRFFRLYKMREGLDLSTVLKNMNDLVLS